MDARRSNRLFVRLDAGDRSVQGEVLEVDRGFAEGRMFTAFRAVAPLR
jgi:hypothetical protein